MEFNTQICTTHEQSKRLLAMGLNPETSDAVLWNTGCQWVPDAYSYMKCVETVKNNWKGNIEEYCLPAWSLHRLLAMINRSTMAWMLYQISYDNIIEQLEADIACGFLEPKYLTDKKEGK